jgi:nicotinamidase-related amidase
MGKRGLIVIDVQCALFEESVPAHDGEAVVGRIRGLIESARGAGVPVIYVQHDGGPGDPLAPGQAGWAIRPEIAPVPGEVVIEKRTPDSFHETNLQAELTAGGITDLVLCGLQTDCCVDATTRGAASRGYNVTLVADAHTTSPYGAKPGAQIIADHNRELGALATVKPAAEVSWTR